MTNVRSDGRPQWRLATDPANRYLTPLIEFCKWKPDRHAVGGGESIKGEMWFTVPARPVFAVAGFWQRTAKGPRSTMVT